LNIFRTTDVARIKGVLCDEWIFDRISEDGVAVDNYSVDINDAIIYLTDNDLTGLFIIHPVNGITQECHTQVLNREKAFEFTKSCIDWVWENTGTMKLVAQIPEIYPDVCRFAEKQGFEREGVNKMSYLKNGEIHSQYYYGLARPEV